MSVSEHTVKADRRYLDSKSKQDLVVLVMQLMDIGEKREAQLAAAEARIAELTRGAKVIDLQNAEQVHWKKWTADDKAKKEVGMGDGTVMHWCPTHGKSWVDVPAGQCPWCKINALNDQLNWWKTTDEARLREIATLRDDVADLEDCRDQLSRLGKLSGCDHVVTKEERALQVRHIEESFCKLQEWKDAILELVKTWPDFESLPWGGDKEGWGFVFELLKFVKERKDDAVADLAQSSNYICDKEDSPTCVWFNNGRKVWISGPSGKPHLEIGRTAIIRTQETPNA